MNKLTAIKREREGQLHVVQLFMEKLIKCTHYWKKVRHQNGVINEVTEMV